MYTVFGLLTLERLDALSPGIFAEGTVSDNPVGVHMTGSDKLLRWVAVRGEAPDWAIYIGWAEQEGDFGETIYNGASYIASHGDKVASEEHIKKLVQCDKEAFARYRL